MLKPLADGLSQWKPSRRALSPIDAVRAQWSSLVGVEIARNSLPADISGETLVVTTRSGAWSQQLSFLEPKILDKLAEASGVAGITSLRFRVGRIIGAAPVDTRPVTPRRARSPHPATPASVHSPAADLDELRARIAVHVRESVAAPGRRCRTCRLRIPEGTHCAPCRHRIAAERRIALLRLLSETPWLDDTAVRAQIAFASPAEITAARDVLLTRWFAELERLRRSKTFAPNAPERATAVAYVLMRSGLPPDHLTPALARHVLGPQLEALLYPDESATAV